jgi:NADH-quinone oxidoreductase subunit G
MKYGLIKSSMAEKKVAKEKKAELCGSLSVDHEKCILCGKCTAFFEDVINEEGLIISGRGSQARLSCINIGERGSSYIENLVDLCPTGALSSSNEDYRFPTWVMEERESCCTVCSQVCKVNLFYFRGQLKRVKGAKGVGGVENWLCDYGRDELKREITKNASFEYKEILVVERCGEELARARNEYGPDSIAVAISGVLSDEEIEKTLFFFHVRLGVRRIYHWRSSQKLSRSNDGVLRSSDPAPNTLGLIKRLEADGLVVPWESLEEGILSNRVKWLLVVAPERSDNYKEFIRVSELLKRVKKGLWIGSVDRVGGDNLPTWQLAPISMRKGTVTNCDGKERKLGGLLESGANFEDVIDSISVGFNRNIERSLEV